ncbi:hypothetical protein CVT26_006748 [Gymnopilus dilepis]|uniref:Uncharacterized protein n=1 Tax=Gymnopilus dilepis TaxID=231916 RepID=A0A409W1N9_9AGAR|nr:hypothetical protein CVT26_006748 [Gymnopilus dilepis]
MYIRAFGIASLASYLAPALALNFSSSSWIWTNEVRNGAAAASRAFRNDWCPPQGKVPSAASIIITVDNAFTLFLNGNAVGSASDWTTVQSYCVTLEAGCNTFAVDATNSDVGPAGVLFAASIVYTDGSTSTLVSDGSWRYNLLVPAGFAQPSYDDSTWPFAIAEGGNGASPWKSFPPPPQPGQLFLPGANWIWTNEVTVPPGPYAPVGSRAFRYTIDLPPGQSAIGAIVYMAADDMYTLYIQGQEIGMGGRWNSAQTYFTEFQYTLSKIVIAVNATNTGGSAGLIAAVLLVMTNAQCSPIMTGVTNAGWKFSTSLPTDWQSPLFNDSTWASAVNEGPYGMQPWGQILW